MIDVPRETSSLARDVSAACSLVSTAGQSESEEAVSLLVERASALLRSLGYGVYPLAVAGSPAREGEPAYRVEASADYVVRDIRRAAGMARSRAEKHASGLCTPEPLEEDPMGVLLDLLDLEVPLADLRGVVDLVRLEQRCRPLTSTERRR